MKLITKISIGLFAVNALFAALTVNWYAILGWTVATAYAVLVAMYQHDERAAQRKGRGNE